MPLFLLNIFSIHSYDTIVHSSVPSLYSKQRNEGKSRLNESTLLTNWPLHTTLSCAAQMYNYGFYCLLTVQSSFKGDVLFILWMSPLQQVKRTHIFIWIFRILTILILRFGSWTNLELYQFNLQQHAILKFTQTKCTATIFWLIKSKFDEL
jgi:hypothetical protein